MAGPNEIGKAKITVEADVSGVKKPLQEAKTEMRGVANEAKAAGSTIDDSFTAAGAKIEESTKGVRRFVGSLTSAAGAATGLIGVFGLLSGVVVGVKALFDKMSEPDGGLARSTELLEKLADEARGVDKALQESQAFKDLSERAEEASEKLEKARSELARAEIGVARFNATTEKITYIRDLSEIAEKSREVSEAEQLQVTVLQQKADLLELLNKKRESGKRIIEEAAQQRASLESLKAVADALSINLLEPDEQIEARARRQIDIIEELAKKSGSRIIADAAIAAVEESTRRQLEDLKTIADKKEQLEREAAERQHKRNLEMIDREVERFTRGIDGAFGVNSQFTSRLDSIVTDVKLILAATESRPR